MCEELIRQITQQCCQWTGMSWVSSKLIKKQLNNKDEKGTEAEMKTFKYLIGRSPDQFDAFCLMLWGINNKPLQTRARG